MGYSFSMHCNVRPIICLLQLKGLGLMFFRINEGQATVEAAFLIPVLFIALLLILQPGIILYDRMVMNHAAAEGCRLVATLDESSGGSFDRCEELIKRRLGAIPQHDLFHIHEGGCSYKVDISGAGTSVSVSIENRLKMIPLLGTPATLLGVSDDGCISLKAEYGMNAQPDWVSSSSAGIDPDQWVHARD